MAQMIPIRIRVRQRGPLSKFESWAVGKLIRTTDLRQVFTPVDIAKGFLATRQID